MALVHSGDDELLLRDFHPRQQLVSSTHLPVRAAFPAIDAHAHLGRWLSDWIGRPGSWMVDDVPRWLEEMADFNVVGFINLDGRWGDELIANLERFDWSHPGSCATFAHLDWSLTSKTHDFTGALIANLEQSAQLGAAGLKVWKDLGLQIKDHHGALLLPDDPRLSEVWDAAAALGLPVWWHIADPVAFFDPVDGSNENYEILRRRPDWSFHRPGLPSFARLMESFETVISAHPSTTFVALHGGGYPENLDWVADKLDRYPNLSIDIAARLAQLGRQPRATAALIERYPDRVLFGTDQIPPSGAGYPIHFRFLETLDESFPHTDQDPPSLGRWMISGLGLAPEVLRGLYGDNVRRLIPRLNTSPAVPQPSSKVDSP